MTIFGGAARVVVWVVVRWVEGGWDGVIGGRGLEEEVPFEAEEDGVGRVWGGVWPWLLKSMSLAT